MRFQILSSMKKIVFCIVDAVVIALTAVNVFSKFSILAVISLLFTNILSAKEITVSADTSSRLIIYGLSQLEKEIAASGNRLAIIPLDDKSKRADITIVYEKDIAPEGYVIKLSGKQLFVSGGNEKGAMYGLLEVAEQLRFNGGKLSKITAKSEEPRLEFRAIKFNLPFMAYRSSLSQTQQDFVVRDLKFWESFLDMMASNRYNVLSLWSMHPFHYMIRPANFPEACPFGDDELLSWKNFWTSLFRMAHNRGIETYIINWNTFVSPSFAFAHNVALYSVPPIHGGTGDTTKLVERYTREVITQVINEYPDLDGLGITFGERMGGQTPQQRREWLDRTVLAGMKDANRKIKFVYRAPLSANTGSGGSTSEENDSASRLHVESLDVEDAFVEFKFNWSHGHSSPRLFMVHGGELTDKYINPLPTKYKYVWTVRNEDFYVLRWGNSDFIRQFLANNSQQYVGGCFIGSEIFTPALDYTSKPGAHKTWDYHFQRQWLWYAMWGRLLYNPETSDDVFEKMLSAKYGKPVGEDALAAWQIASNNMLKFGSFHRGTADANQYAEGFSAWTAPPDHPQILFNINNIITHPVLDTVLYVNIRTWITNGRKTSGIQISPLQLAEELDRDNEKLWTLIRKLNSKKLSPSALAEINDLTAWYWFGCYFSDKLKAAVALADYRYTDNDRRNEAVEMLEKCSSHWRKYAETITRYNKDTFLFSISKDGYSWTRMQEQVDRDIELAKVQK